MTRPVPNTLTIARREYEQRVRSRAFVVVTAVLAVIGLGLALLPVAVRALGGDKPVAVAVFATDAKLASDSTASLVRLLEAMKAEGEAGYKVTVATDEDAARTRVDEGDLDGLLTISRGRDSELAFDILTTDSENSRWVLTIRSATAQLNIGDRLVRAGIEPADVGQIFAPTPFQVTPLDPEASNVSDDFGPRYILAYALVILTFMAVVTYGNWVAASVVEEKSSRVMELLVTAATPRQLLAGKVLGSGAAGLTQYLVVVVTSIAGLLLQGQLSRALLGSDAPNDGTLQALTPLVLGVFGLFFIGGFALYATMYAALGSTASRQEDVQTVTGPMILVGLAGYLGSFAALNTIDASWVQIASFVPFFSPYLIPARLILGHLAFWEVLLALSLLIGAILVVQAIAARIYSAGILLYGQRVGLRSVWRAVRVHR